MFLSSADDELRLVFVGKTGVGKSATANTIAGKKDVFKSSGRGRSETVYCQCERVEVLGHKLLLTDTPGMFDTERDSKEIEREIQGFVKMTAPGPHAILLVASAGNRFTDEEVKVIEKLEEMFGKAIEKYLIIVVTRTETWDDDGMDVFTFLGDLRTEAKQVLGTCISEKRAIAFQNKFNRDGKPRDETQVKELLAMVAETVRKNGNKCYTEAHWKKAEEEMERRMREIIAKEMKEQQERIEKIEKEQRAKLTEKYTAALKKIEEEEKKRREKEAKERKALEESEQKLRREMEKMQLEAQQEMQRIRAEERARAQEELINKQKRMEVKEKLEHIFAQKQKAEAELQAEMEKEKQRLEEEARYRARKEQENSCNIL